MQVAHNSRPRLSFEKQLFRIGTRSLERTPLQEAKRWLRRLRSRNRALVALVLIALLCLLTMLLTPKPSIVLYLPKLDQSVKKKQVYVRGQVRPPTAIVRINGKPVAVDGSGLFTAFVDAPAGDSTLTIDAYSLGKHSSYVQPITRELTQDELLAQERKRQEQEAAVKQRVLAADASIKELVEQAKNGDLFNIVRVIWTQIKKEGPYSRITGQVTNSTRKPVYGVTVTANFFDVSDQLIDSKQGIAVANGESIEPGKTHDFMTESTDKPFFYYKLTVDWKNDEEQGTTSASFDGNMDLQASDIATTAAQTGRRQRRE